MISKEELKELTKIFQHLDTDNNGELSRSEIKRALMQITGNPVTEEQFDEFMM